jgi:hypothetical protein
LKIIKLVPVIVVCFKVLDKFSQMSLRVHDLMRFSKIKSLYHHLSSASFFNNK